MELSNPTLVIAENGHEDLFHGTDDYPCVLYWCNPNRTRVDWHWHDSVEFVYVREGTLVYAAGHRRFVLEAGDCAFANSGILHAEFAHEGTDALESDFVVCAHMLYGSTESVLYQRYFKELLEDRTFEGCAIRAHGASWEQNVASCIRRARTAQADEEPFFEATVREMLTRACLLVWEHRHDDGSEPQASPIELERVRAMVDYIHQHFAEKVEVEQLAREAHVSVRECQREFARVIGESPSAYLLGHRLARAADMLENTDASVASIAMRCGFSSQSYFGRQFRARFGHTALDHRRLARARAD